VTVPIMWARLFPLRPPIADELAVRAELKLHRDPGDQGRRQLPRAGPPGRRHRPWPRGTGPAKPVPGRPQPQPRRPRWRALTWTSSGSFTTPAPATPASASPTHGGSRRRRARASDREARHAAAV